MVKLKAAFLAALLAAVGGFVMVAAGTATACPPADPQCEGDIVSPVTANSCNPADPLGEVGQSAQQVAKPCPPANPQCEAE